LRDARRIGEAAHRLRGIVQLEKIAQGRRERGKIEDVAGGDAHDDGTFQRRHLHASDHESPLVIGGQAAFGGEAVFHGRILRRKQTHLRHARAFRIMSRAACR
jgi:hypothetical protein